MQPSNFDEANTNLGPPQGVGEDQCSTLRVCRGLLQGKTPVVISCWKPDRAELEEIMRTGRVWLMIWGQTQPPAFVSGYKASILPYVDKAEEGDEDASSGTEEG